MQSLGFRVQGLVPSFWQVVFWKARFDLKLGGFGLRVN